MVHVPIDFPLTVVSCFVQMSKKTVSARVNTNIPAEVPQDVRPRFLSVQNYRLLLAVTRFSTDYAQGVVRINNMQEMNCQELKTPEVLESTACQGECKKKFTRNNAKSLFCVVDKSVDLDDVARRWSKFRFMCKDCSDQYIFTEPYHVVQLYPSVGLDNIKVLCDEGFITKYVFPIKLECTEVVTQTEVPNYHDFYKVVKSIVKDKKPHEQITKLQLLTYGRVLFTETDYDCVMKSTVDPYGEMATELEFYPQHSSMMAFLPTYKDTKPLTYIYRVVKQVYSSNYDNYVVYFPIKCTLYCKLCKDNKIYLKVHPVLYCSQCGFTDALFFRKSTVMANTMFFKECVKSKTQKPRRIIYYDMVLYKTMVKKLK
ncbi:me53 [Peridroma alphabaculovirus]|uniref:Me53 n=1 Tax=Peridroma alphabaculovirus TaxID=1346829 RepID=A0A068LK44_9ABAC|nr:me53 [Peridroma alphabaculovirus]AIE47739.1 me53 [Peridroma alphabaculovirus]